jgi:hypothetical protein
MARADQAPVADGEAPFSKLWTVPDDPAEDALALDWAEVRVTTTGTTLAPEEVLGGVMTGERLVSLVFATGSKVHGKEKETGPPHLLVSVTVTIAALAAAGVADEDEVDSLLEDDDELHDVAVVITASVEEDEDEVDRVAVTAAEEDEDVEASNESRNQTKRDRERKGREQAPQKKKKKHRNRTNQHADFLLLDIFQPRESVLRPLPSAHPPLQGLVSHVLRRGLW